MSEPTSQPALPDDDWDPASAASDPTGVQAPWSFYPGLHTSYAIVTLFLLASGLLIQLPDLRASLVGGYGRWLASLHEWTGLLMLVLPAIVFLPERYRALATFSIRRRRRDDLHMHAINLWFTVVSGVVFVVTGLLLWFPALLSDALLDFTVELHVLFTYLLILIIPLHIVASRERALARVSGWLEACKARLSKPERRARRKDREDLACSS